MYEYLFLLLYIYFLKISNNIVCMPTLVRILNMEFNDGITLGNWDNTPYLIPSTVSLVRSPLSRVKCQLCIDPTALFPAGPGINFEEIGKLEKYRGKKQSSSKQRPDGHKIIFRVCFALTNQLKRPKKVIINARTNACYNSGSKRPEATPPKKNRKPRLTRYVGLQIGFRLKQNYFCLIKKKDED